MRYEAEGGDPANAGLQHGRAFLEPVKEKHPWITYSDLWTLAGVVAIKEMGGPEIPWQGGRTEGEVQEADAALGQRRAELADLQGRIEADVRNAFLDLETAARQLEVARNNRTVAKDTLKLTRQRFEAGIADAVEVTQAQESVASADLDYITGVFAHNLSKVALARAMGRAEERIGRFLQMP